TASGIMSDGVVGGGVQKKAAQSDSTRHVTVGAPSADRGSARAHAAATVSGRGAPQAKIPAQPIAGIASSRRTVLAPDGSLRFLASLSSPGKRDLPRVGAQRDTTGPAAGSAAAKALIQKPVLSAPAPKPPATATVGYRPINEVGNNVANPRWGTAGTDLLRVS